jgi:hypothetical protein
LDELKALRQTDRRKYWSPAVQERESQLYAQLEALKAGDAPTKGEATDDDDDTISVEDLPLPESLKKQWAKSGPLGVEDALKAVRSRTTLALGSLDEDDADGFRSSFDSDLDEEAQEAIVSGLAVDGGQWPVATEAEVEDFRAMEWGPGLINEWGASAPKLLGRARREGEAMLAAMSDVGRIRTERWIAGMSVKRRAAVIRALAARAARRL